MLHPTQTSLAVALPLMKGTTIRAISVFASTTGLMIGQVKITIEFSRWHSHRTRMTC